uniref:Uncharacterized protein n=1 Tax=Glossina brevipalpis TaxID=37001 RepID=A0A1A9W3S2_9MUSC
MATNTMHYNEMDDKRQLLCCICTKAYDDNDDEDGEQVGLRSMDMCPCWHGKNCNTAEQGIRTFGLFYIYVLDTVACLYGGLDLLLPARLVLGCSSPPHTVVFKLLMLRICLTLGKGIMNNSVLVSS